MAKPRNERTSFADTLQRIETLEEAIKRALAPAPGWEWSRAPSDRIGGIGGGSHVLTLGWPPTERGGPWEPHLAVYVARGGAAEAARPEQRAVAFDREGTRYILEYCCEGHADHDASSEWVEAKLFKLPPQTLPRANVAFVGIETKRENAHE